MKENRPYPPTEEEDGSSLTAQEPVVRAVDYANDYDHSDIPHIPGLPATWDELLECLKEGEEEIDQGGGIPWEEVLQSTRNRIRRYGA